MKARRYLAGFGLSVALTLVAFGMVAARLLPTKGLVLVLAGLALIQFLVQMRLFLHLGEEAAPRWRLTSFWFMTLVVLILVGGSIWIMDNLNYHMMSPSQIDHYMNSQDGL